MSFSLYHSLAYCSPGHSFCWTPLCSRYNPTVYEDFVYSTARKQLFCATECGSFESWDFRDPLSPRLNWKMVASDVDVDYDPDNYYPLSPHLKLDSLKYLVFAERSDRLFLVRRRVIEEKIASSSIYHRHPPYQTVGFDVHELITVDPEGAKKRGKLIYMDGKLDGMAFFIGSTGHGFVIEDKDKMMENVKPDSIYFTDRKERTPRPHDGELTTRKLYAGHDLGIFNYENKTFSSCYYPCDPENVRGIKPTPTWFVPSSPPS